MERCGAVSGEGRGGSGKESAPEGGRHGTAAQDSGHSPHVGAQGVLGHCSHIQALGFGWSCVGLGFGHSDPYGSLATLGCSVIL